MTDETRARLAYEKAEQRALEAGALRRRLWAIWMCELDKDHQQTKLFGDDLAPMAPEGKPRQ